VLRHVCGYCSSQPASPKGHGKGSSIHWAHRSTGSMHVVQVEHLPDSPADVPRALPLGLDVTEKLGRRNRSTVVEVSQSRMASHRAPAGRPWPKLG
jgi:hypothetical protein